MEAFSIINIPAYMQKKIAQNAMGVSIDYKRFNIKSMDVFRNLFFQKYMPENDSNSNIKYNGKVAHVRVNSPRWIAQQAIVTFEEVGAVPIVFVEEYAKWQWLKWSIARIDFYGAFFHFYDDLPRQYQELYKYLNSEAIKWDNKVRVTRLDIAVDVDMPFPQKWYKWITPAKHSQREVEMYRHWWLYNSYWYLAEKNSWYWVRIYDKTVQVKKTHKESWYWWADKISENWTRIEFEFYNPYCSMGDEKIIDMVKERIAWWDIEIGSLPRPCYTFNVENAYKYFERYAKNHWLDIWELLRQVQDEHYFREKTKEYYWLVDED